MTYLLHVANVLYLGSYLVKDILWLRLLTVVAGVLLMLTFYFRADPLWGAIGWNALFTAINVAQIVLLVRERRPVRLTDREQRLYKLAFRSLSPREFRRLLDLATWQDAADGAELVAKGRELDRVMIITDGAVDVSVSGRPPVHLGPGRFIGEMSFLSGQAPTADVTARGPTRLVVWPAAELRAFLAGAPDLRSALQLVLGNDLVTKLRA